MYVSRTKNKHKIEKVESSFVYRDKYKETNQIHDAARTYMNHSPGATDNSIERNQEFTNEIVVAFQGLDGLLNVRIKV